MNWLLDTDVASQSSKPKPDRRVLAWIRRYQSDCYLSQLTVAEMAYGVAIAPAERRDKLAGWLATLRTEYQEALLPVTEAVLVAWKELLADLKAAGGCSPRPTRWRCSRKAGSAKPGRTGRWTSKAASRSI